MAFTRFTGNCALKDHVPAPTTGQNMFSGVRRGWEINVDRPGLDIAQYSINGPLSERRQASGRRGMAFF